MEKRKGIEASIGRIENMLKYKVNMVIKKHAAHILVVNTEDKHITRHTNKKYILG